MATLRTATSAFKKKVEAFKRAYVGKVKDGMEMDLVAGGKVLLGLNLDRWNTFEEAYDKLCESYPDPDKDEELLVSSDYAIHIELLDRAQTSYN